MIKSSLFAVMAAASLMTSVMAHAALGGAPTLPATALGGGEALKAQTGTTFSVRSSTLPNGTQEREYVNSSGTVFGIAWNGPFQPNLKNFMGSDVFAQYSTAVQAAQAGSRHGGSVVVSTDGVVAQVTGHQRAFAGKAYVPSLLPAGVTASDVQ